MTYALNQYALLFMVKHYCKPFCHRQIGLTGEDRCKMFSDMVISRAFQNEMWEILPAIPISS